MRVHGQAVLRQVETKAKMELQLSLTRLQADVEHGFRDADLPWMQGTVSELGANHTIIDAVVLDHKRRALASMHRVHIGRPLEAISGHFAPQSTELILRLISSAETTSQGWVELTRDGNTLCGAYPVLLIDASAALGPHGRGVIWIQQDLRPLKTEAISMIERQGLSFLFGIASFAGLLAVFFHFGVTRPVESLIEATQRMARGELTPPASVSGRGEFRTLARAFNAMMLQRSDAEKERTRLETHLRQQQKLESLGTLASGVAHEINNPIHGIMSYARLIEDRIDPQSPLHDFAVEIGEESKRVAAIVSSLLAFARYKQEPTAAISMREVVTDTLSLVARLIREDRIAFVVDIADDVLTVNGRAPQLQQVLMNLVTNARDALNSRYPVGDTNKTMKVTVDLCRRNDETWVRTTIEDHGLGIPGDVAGRLFDPFFTTKDRAHGTGLGLSISHGIIEEHGGELSFESEPRKCTRFVFELPVASQPRTT